MDATFFPSSAAWRAWLEEHHETASELLLGFYKTNAGVIRNHLRRSGGRSAVLWLDRRCSQAHRRESLYYPAYTAQAPQYLERGQHQASGRTRAAGADAALRAQDVQRARS